MGEKPRPVLVVDDDADIRDAIRATLEQEGYATAEAKNGAEALRYLVQQPRPLLVLLDWNMAPMNGAEFMLALADTPAAAGVPIVLLTADGRVPAEEAMARGFAGYLKKPVRLEQLFAMVERHCGDNKVAPGLEPNR